jgi:uncharacterized protein YbjQ (UPF0145 family)
MKIRWLMLAVLPVLVSGCAHMDYAGESFPPTQHVDLFFSEANVGRDYMVIGELTGTGDQLVSTQKLQDKMVEKAREKGADGVVILGLEHIQSGENTSYSENTTQGQKKGKTVTTTSGSSTTSAEEKKRIRALLIKYKAPAAQP